MGTVDEHLAALKSALVATSVPCSSGVFATCDEDLILYYGKDEASRRLDFTNASDEALQHLAETCEAAPFGLNQQTVLDENYRKAGKLDSAYFSPKFSPEASGLLDTVHEFLLEGHFNQSVRAELYKLNVYGPGSFFKSHKDTPRGDNMFGTLVVVYPTRHEGGALIFRDGGLEYVFDTAAEVAKASGPSIAFAVFYSDVEHEVALMKSGYRVTLTYNLYYVDAPKTSITEVSSGCEHALRTAFRALIADSHKLPKGGQIGFGLRHEYPLNLEPHYKSSASFRSLGHLLGALKGSDAILVKVCQELGLRIHLRTVYHGANQRILVLCPGSFAVGHEKRIEEWDVVPELRKKGGKLLTAIVKGLGHEGPEVDIVWATDPLPTNIKKADTAVLLYGNEASVGHAYGHVCILVDIPQDPALFPDPQAGEKAVDTAKDAIFIIPCQSVVEYIPKPETKSTAKAKGKAKAGPVKGDGTAARPGTSRYSLRARPAAKP